MGEHTVTVVRSWAGMKEPLRQIFHKIAILVIDTTPIWIEGDAVVAALRSDSIKIERDAGGWAMLEIRRA